MAVGLGFYAFVEVAERWVGRRGLDALDEAGERMASSHASPSLDAVMRTVTWLGSGWVAVPLVRAVAAWITCRRAWPAPGVLLVGFGTGEALAYALEAVFARARPDGDLSALGASFPSGHAFTATLTFGLIAYLVASGQLLGEAGLGARTAAVVALGLLVVVVAFSRVYLRAHCVRVLRARTT